MQLLHKAAGIDVYCNPQELYFKTFDFKLHMNQHMEKQRVASANSERANAHSRGGLVDGPVQRRISLVFNSFVLQILLVFYLHVHKIWVG